MAYKGPQGELIPETLEELRAKTGRDSTYKPLGAGYAPVGGQAFPEACAFELGELGPQGEPLGHLNRPDSAIASGTDRGIQELFADDRYSPFSLELASEDGGAISDPEMLMRFSTATGEEITLAPEDAAELKAILTRAWKATWKAAQQEEEN